MLVQFVLQGAQVIWYRLHQVSFTSLCTLWLLCGLSTLVYPLAAAHGASLNSIRAGERAQTRNPPPPSPHTIPSSIAAQD